MPFDPRKPFDPSGLRLGTPAITTRGLREEHMPQVAAWMDEAVTAAAKDDEATLDRIAGEVRDLLSAFPAPAGIPGDRPARAAASAHPTRLRRSAGSRGPSTGCPPRTPW